MKDLLSWTLEAIRAEEGAMSWMEERRYDWAPIVGDAIGKLLSGQTLILLSDEKNRWFERYIIERINRPGTSRPLLPFFSCAALYPAVDAIRSDQDIDIFFDLLAIAFPQGYFFWYIGKADHPRARIALRNDESLLWVMDETLANSFTLRSSDEALDTKLLQLFSLFDRTLSAALFAQVDPVA